MYVNIKKPIGIVKNGVIYDHARKPVYLSQQTNKGAFGCFGPPTFKVRLAKKLFLPEILFSLYVVSHLGYNNDKIIF